MAPGGVRGASASRGPSRRVPSLDEGSDLNALVAHPTQRRLLLALVVTLLCLPLLVLDVVQGSTTSGASELAVTSDSSLVVATLEEIVPEVDPSSVEMGDPESSTVAEVPTTTAAPPVTAAPQVTTTTTRRPTTTTTQRAAAPPSSTSLSPAEFLACVRHRESRGDYTASDPTGTFLGAYQIYQGGWDAVARSMGRTDLVGVPPNQASPADQDAVALAMYALHGTRPWGGACR